jgi:Ca2+-binding EF-hand superfamily protein
MDADEDGLVSILDLRVLIQRYLELELSKFDVQLLMRRLSKRSPDDMITYEEFAYEFAPRQNTTRRMTSPTSSK